MPGVQRCEDQTARLDALVMAGDAGTCLTVAAYRGASNGAGPGGVLGGPAACGPSDPANQTIPVVTMMRIDPCLTARFSQ